MSEDERFCPDHALPGSDLLERWACPDTCLYFLDELERRIDDVRVNGNFVRVRFRRHRMFKQYYRNHRPVSGWVFAGVSASLETSRMHEMYRRRRRGKW